MRKLPDRERRIELLTDLLHLIHERPGRTTMQKITMECLGEYFSYEILSEAKSKLANEEGPII